MPVPGTTPITQPGQPPGWPTTEAGRQVRTQAERAKGTPTEKLPIYAQEETKAREQEIAKANMEAAVAPFKALSQVEANLQPAAAKAMEMSFTPDIREQYKFYAEAATGFRMFEVSVEEFRNWAMTGIPPARKLKDRPQVYKPATFDIGSHIDRFAELYANGVTTGKITQEQYNTSLLKMIDSQGVTWPDPTKDFPPFPVPGADPNNTQDRMIANKLGIFQEEVNRIRTQGTDQEKEDLIKRYQDKISLDEGRKAARFDIVQSARLGKTKEATEALFQLAVSYGLTPIEQKGWVAKTLKSIKTFLSGPREKQPTDAQVFSYLDRLTQGLGPPGTVTSSGQLPPGKPLTSGVPPTATTWIDDALKKK